MNPIPTRFLTFAISAQRFGILLAAVQEVVRAVHVERLPKAPPIVEGVIDLRGTVIPVLDIRARFKLPQRAVDLGDHLVVARAAGRLVALRVDRVLEIASLQAEDVDDIRHIAPTSAYVAGVARCADGLVLLHDLATFLSAAEAESLTALAEEKVPA